VSSAQTLFNLRLSAPVRSTLAVLKDEVVSHAVFGNSTRRRLYNLRHVYDPAFPSYFNDGDDLAAAEASAVHHPLEWVLAEGPRPDPQLCLQRLRAIWLHVENRAGQLNNDPVLPFRHQAALVEFLTNGVGPQRVLIADEVGLGKTVEAGLVLRHLLRRNPTLRVLYLTLGGLVENVLNEFDRLDLPKWSFFGTVSPEAQARLNAVPIQAITAETRLVVASIHRLLLGEQLGTQSRYLGESRFDVVIVDECHTLRAYGPSADSPQVWFSGVRQLLDRHLEADGRVYFMSATPHQGHREVFLNLVALCTGVALNASPAEKAGAARGRVVFRVKEHVRDWDGRRVFPFRDVRPPALAAPPENYSDVLKRIGEHFDWIAASFDASQSRAVGFVKSQALQYAASSLRAGFAYLLRRLLRYYPAEAGSTDVVRWATRLVPYRGERLTGAVLAQRWAKEGTRRLHQAEEEEEQGSLSEDYGDVTGAAHEIPRLKKLLAAYDSLFDDPNAGTKILELRRLLEGNPEPVVVFSQAVDTVFELETKLRESGFETYRVSGEMPFETRMGEIQSFRVSMNPRRVLVSSAAGGVGINLQVARRVIHFDLPWNPMALEQRVGRVHRIGSDRTILVDTILLDGSREADVFQRITVRLEGIVRDLSADPAEREALFRRILASMNAEYLRDIMAGDRDLDEIGHAIDEGRRAVEEVDRDMRQIATEAVGEQGRARMAHLLKFLHTADIKLAASQTPRTYATLTEIADGEFQRSERQAEAFTAEDWDEPLVFDRTAAAYLQLRRNQTGGLGHPAIDPVLRACLELTPELEKARVSAWITTNWLPPGIEVGSILLFELVAKAVAGSFSDVALRCVAVTASGQLSEVDFDAVEELIWNASFSTSRRAGEFPSSDLLIDVTSKAAAPDLIRWPLAAVGIRGRD